MKKRITILGSTGSIGLSTLKIIDKKKNYFFINLLSANKNFKKICEQIYKYRPKIFVITDKRIFKKVHSIFKKKKIKIYNNFDDLNFIKNDITISAIPGIAGLEPTIKIIKTSKKILIANKESIICGWKIIKNTSRKFNTKLVPIDSEHFSIMQLLESQKRDEIEKIFITASGGPFLNRALHKFKNIKPNDAIKHPKWKMGKKISIDSATMMNKVFEFIEAKKIFNLNKKYLSIFIHPSSYIHAIVFFKGNLIKFLAHDTSMSIPISNALNIKHKLNKNYIKKNINKFNELKLHLPSKKKFPLLSILDYLPDEETYFEIILITINDELVNKYLKGKINFLSIQNNLLNLIKSPYFKKFYKLKPKNIYDIKNMIVLTKNYLNKNIIYYEKYL